MKEAVLNFSLEEWTAVLFSATSAPEVTKAACNIWHGISIKIRVLRKTPFKQQLSKVLLQTHKYDEINVAMHYTEISKYLSLFN